MKVSYLLAEKRTKVAVDGADSVHLIESMVLMFKSGAGACDLQSCLATAIVSPPLSAGCKSDPNQIFD